MKHRAQDYAELDATARRITDMYGKAVDQLASDKAPVRLGGLHALERFAQDSADSSLRQAVVNVICAYLRMPFSDLDDLLPDDADADARASYEQRAQERQVRRAAQSILSTHLRPGNDPEQPLNTFWADIDIDLSEATLLRFRLDGARLQHASFERATFTVNAMFEDAVFSGRANFDGTTFSGNAWFSRTTFHEYCDFEGAAFGDMNRFQGITFKEKVSFHNASFGGTGRFEHSIFNKDVEFGARFKRGINFDGVTVNGTAAFGQAQVAGSVSLEQAEFRGPISLLGAKFDEGIPEPWAQWS